VSEQISVEVCIWGYSNVEEFGISSSGFEVPDPEPTRREGRIVGKNYIEFARSNTGFT
jgi:hypothetical protein